MLLLFFISTVRIVVLVYFMYTSAAIPDYNIHYVTIFFLLNTNGHFTSHKNSGVTYQEKILQQT